MGQQPDPDNDFRMRWVLLYTKEERCQCTRIISGGVNLIPVTGWKEHFYSDSPLPFVNSHDVEELRALLKCDEGKGTLINKMQLLHP